METPKITQSEPKVPQSLKVQAGHCAEDEDERKECSLTRQMQTGQN